MKILKKIMLSLLAIIILLITINSATAAPGLLNNLAQYLTFDDIDLTGNTLVDKAETINGTKAGTMTTGATGIVGESFNFSGDDARVFTNLLDTKGNTEITINLWVRTDDTTGLILTDADAVDGNLNSPRMFNGKVQFFRAGNTVEITTPTINSNSWTMITMTYSDIDNNMSVYINGTYRGSDNKGTLDDAERNSTFGQLTTGLGDANANYTGLIDEYGFWNGTILTQAQITDLFNNGQGLNYSDFGGAGSINITDINPSSGINFILSNTTQHINFNAAVNSTSNFTCATYINSTLNTSNSYENGTNVAVDFDINFGVGSFSWYIDCNNTNSSETTATRTFNIASTGIDNCSTYSMRAINFSIRNEANGTLVVGDIDGVFTITNIDFQEPFNLTWSGSSQYGLCISPNGSSTFVDAQFEYSAPGFEIRTYYFDNATLDNVTEVINLSLSNATTAVTFTVTDENDNTVADVFIHILKYDFGTDSYITSEIIKTDEQGESIGGIIQTIQWYKFILTFQGTAVLETEPVKITGTTRNFRINLQANFFELLNQLNDVQTGLTFTNSTLNFAYTFVNPTGVPVTACLRVIQRSSITDTLIDKTCVTAASGTILVNIGTPVHGKTFIGTGTIQINPIDLTNVLDVSFVDGYKKWGKDGIFITMFVRLSLATIGIWNPMVALIFLILADLGMIWAGLYYLSPQILIFYIILAIITMYKVNRK